ncbi:MAG: hypothetical protein ACLQVX_21595 [Limisphaerales bacterium]
MQTRSLTRRLRRKPALLALALLLTGTALAYPPAPFHVIYGMARDQYGTPFTTASTTILLQTPAGVRLTGSVCPGLAAGVNYQIDVPMDAGLTPDLYQSSALVAAAPFKLYVVAGGATNEPLQMTGNFSLLGKPGQRTRLDLTLGVDANGDGIPDAWEQAFLTAIGSSLSLSNLNPNLVLTSDGLTLWQEFLAGTYPFDPDEPFLVKLVSITAGAPLLEFTTMTGRSYTVLGSSDLNQWTPLSFQVPAEGGAIQQFYYAPNISTVQVQILPDPTGAPMRFFRLMLQ